MHRCNTPRQSAVSRCLDDALCWTAIVLCHSGLRTHCAPRLRLNRSRRGIVRGTYPYPTLGPHSRTSPLSANPSSLVSRSALTETTRNSACLPALARVSSAKPMPRPARPTRPLATYHGCPSRAWSLHLSGDITDKVAPASLCSSTCIVVVAGYHPRIHPRRPLAPSAAHPRASSLSLGRRSYRPEQAASRTASVPPGAGQRWVIACCPEAPALIDPRSSWLGRDGCASPVRIMTSRPPPGVPPRQTQRGHGSKLAAQRPSHPPHSLSQKCLSTSASPARRDAPADATDHHVPGRHHAATPRRGGSKLRLELFSEWTIELSPTHESPQIPTPSRAAPLSAPLSAPDAIDNNKPSPANSHDLQPDLEKIPLPMPRRRPPLTERHATASRPPAAATAPPKKDARPRPYTVQVPADAPRFISVHKHDLPNRDTFSKGLHTGYADFFPWSGQHHEDEWSPDAIQKGTWDRGTQNETASARLAVLPALRQKNGINSLSTVFMGVVNHRRFRGQILAPSTFKPPPRVTLTDTKREVWLKDLANPTISLRRLSRTIPHGIRGRILLDQCLNKNVPTERAMWLAKCVGANEIRAFKRKGTGGAFIMGGESKWVRDWTGHVEQFVEATLSGFSEPDWKARTTYAYVPIACLPLNAKSWMQNPACKKSVLRASSGSRSLPGLDCIGLGK